MCPIQNIDSRKNPPNQNLVKGAEIDSIPLQAMTNIDRSKKGQK